MITGTSSSASYVSHVASRLQDLSAARQQQIQVDMESGEKVLRARQGAVEQSMQDMTRQAEMVNEIRTTGLKAIGGNIDVWA